MEPNLSKEARSNHAKNNDSMRDINVDALKDIKKKTRFFWQGLVELDHSQNFVKEEVKESTFKRIINSIIILNRNGLLSYKTVFAYEMITNKEKVYILEVTDIAPQLKNWVRLIESGEI